MKKAAFTIALLLAICICFGQQPAQTTEFFAFHNDFWMNLHHFLYQKAKGSQLSKLQEDGMGFLTTAEDSVVLNADEKQTLNRATAYYQDNFVDKSLRRDLGDIRIWLQRLPEQNAITDTSFSPVFTDILNDVSKLYRRKFWPIHRELNLSVLHHHIASLRTLEAGVIHKMEELAMYKWPDSTRVRVDLTAYANYAGAYTATRPAMNIVISTIDPLNNTSSFIETVYHEGSHLLFNYQDSPFRGEIYHQAKALGIDFPRNLWHASLFYLCGRATQDALRTMTIEHELDMDVRYIFTGYNTTEFRNTLEDYYLGKVDLKEAVALLLSSLKND